MSEAHLDLAPRPRGLLERFGFGEAGDMLAHLFMRVDGQHPRRSLGALGLERASRAIAIARSQRKAECQSAVDSLSRRIADYRPEAIVSLLIGIKPFVDEAAKEAGSNVATYAVPFPGMGTKSASKLPWRALYLNFQG
jgi:hypothetical protein